MSRPDDHGDAAFNSHLAQSVFPNSPIQMVNLNGSGGLLATIINNSADFALAVLADLLRG
jgi:hypothetical protein